MTHKEIHQQIDANLLKITENQLALQATVSTLADAVTQFVVASAARMEQMQASLDVLIKAITIKGGNGKAE